MSQRSAFPPDPLLQPELAAAANAAASALDADLLLFQGDLQWGARIPFLETLRRREIRRPNLVLLPVTWGGSADCAYGIARALQDAYGSFTGFVTGSCKSAGTILLLGASQLVIRATGELGPIDVQLGRQDELRRGSGLDLEQALKVLEQVSAEFLDRTISELLRNTSHPMTWRTAAEIATGLAVGLYGPVFGKIDPLRVGEVSRAMAVARLYGIRLDAVAGNLKGGRALDALISAYPSHGFVIDFNEASELFKRVDRPNDELEALALALGDRALFPMEGSFELGYLNPEVMHAGLDRAASSAADTDPKPGSKENVNAPAPRRLWPL